MIYTSPPDDFNPIFEVVGCICECEEEILMLLRQDDKPEGNTWGHPGGKRKIGEFSIDSAIREVEEETKIRLNPASVKYACMVYVRYPDKDFSYEIFRTKLPKKHEVVLNPSEHKDFKWVSPREALKLNLVPDEDYCIKAVYGIE